ncbi:NAD-dependent epimerase/dehydratase family protein [Tersicoccus sp. MR15.9]|uniref:NAD-dependent epimerase/dehydratase family protein n=1 Tax=Tersicoccus mangrovi TaxID=3121635 RepID=UPI002FE5B81D
MKPPVLIVGCGDLGTEAGLRFAAAGHPVTGWRRNPSVLPPELHGQAADVTYAGSLPPVDPATGVVVIALTPGSRDADGYRATYLDGTRAALAAVAAAGASPRVLFVSSTSVVGVDDGREVDESWSGEPASATGAVLAEAERLVLALPGAVVLRLAGVYGPGRTRLIDRARSGDGGRAAHWTNRIHRDDAAIALMHLASLADPAPVYHGVDDEPALEADVLAFLAGELGVPAGVDAAHPVAPSSLAAASDDPRYGGTGDSLDGIPSGVPDAGESSGASNGSPDAVGRAPSSSPGEESPSGKRLPNVLLRSTGWAPAYPSYREGYRAMLAGVGTRQP